MNESVPTATATVDTPRHLLIRLADDAWSLTQDDRLELRREFANAHIHWMQRLNDLIEPPLIDDSFPAFLLGTTPFQDLGDAIGEAVTRSELDTGTADQLQRFVDHYRAYLLGTEAS